MRVAATVVPLALLATSCGAKAEDPYEKSLAMGSEHVEFTGTVLEHGKRVRVTGSGDFTNSPDRGTATIHRGEATFREVYDGERVYVRVGKQWLSAHVGGAGPNTPAQMLRRRLPARIEDGLVRHVDVKTADGTLSVDFSQYGKHVSVTVPRVKGTK